MAGLLDGVLPYLYSRGDAAKRALGGLLDDPLASITQTLGGLTDSAREQQGLMGQAFSDPKRPFRPTNQQALGLLIENAMNGPLGMAPTGMTKTIKSGLMPKDYQIDHKPLTDAGGAARLHDLEPVFGPDIYGKNALQYFGSGDARERAIVKALAAVRGKPDEMVTIYRGVPDGVSAINAGDWVTLDPRVAADYGKTVSMRVPASHVTSWPDSLLEFGYYPPK